jgi:diguanylate cyclase (GGDEF)-like protein
VSIIDLMLLGGAKFGSDEQYLQFRFQILFFSLVAGVVTCGSLVLGDWLGSNDLGRIRLVGNEVFLLINLVLLSLLWGHRNRLAPVAWLFFTAWFLENTSVLWHATNDEFRIVWFLLQIGTVYVILGLVPGFMTAALSLGTIIVANGYSPAPYSRHAMVTVVTSLCAATVFLHVYTRRLITFHQRLVDSNRQLGEMSSRDPLTGVQNARAFYELSDLLIRQAMRSGTPFSVLFIDLDHFKSINDQFGHEAGDQVLKEVAACLKRGTRSTDAFGRIGGEEFMMFLPHTDLAGAKSLAEKLRRNVESLMPSVGETRIPVTVSIGIAEGQTEREMIGDIKQRADRAMYQAKAAGRNRIMSFEDS